MTFKPRRDWLELDDGFHDVVQPVRFPEHHLRFWNERALQTVGLHTVDPVEHFARFEPLPGSLPEPLALRYHGHQFRHYNPDLGDGRGFLYAQVEDGHGRLLDIGTKGSGPTPWSRGGDGRLTLQGGVREVLAAELLEARGVKTCRILTLVETGERLSRHDEPSPTRSCVMTRLSWSNVRFGTFQRLRYFQDKRRMERLLDYCQRLVPHDSPTHFLAQVTERAAETCAGWIAADFVHGVLNTDNLNITGESFDYGPWRFLPELDPMFTAAYFDHSKLYSFARQPEAVFWNLQRLAEALSELVPMKELSPALNDFGPALDAAMKRRFAARLGLKSVDDALLGAFETWLRTRTVGYDEAFHHIWGGEVRGSFEGAEFVALQRALESAESAGHARPPLCSLYIDEVRAIWADIAERDDWSSFEDKVTAIRASRLPGP